MKGILYIFIIGLATNLSLQAQNTSAKAKQYLAKASQRLEANDHIYLGFTYTFENNKVSPPVVQTEEGNIAIKEEDFHLNFLGTEQIKQGNKIYTILTEDKEVQVTEFEENETQSVSPVKILSSYQKGYSYKIDKTVKEKGKDILYIILKPNVSEEVKKILVVLDKKSLKVQMVKQWATNGSITTFTITEYAPNKKLPKDYFVFNKANYEGYYIAE